MGVPPLARQQRIVIARGRAGVLNTQAKLGAIIFGCDGVLIDSEKDGHRVALNQAIAEVLFVQSLSPPPSIPLWLSLPFDTIMFSASLWA